MTTELQTIRWEPPTETIDENGIHILTQDDIDFLKRVDPRLFPLEPQPFSCRYRKTNCLGKRCQYWLEDQHCHHPVVTFSLTSDGKRVYQGQLGGWRRNAGRPKGSVNEGSRDKVKFNIQLDGETAAKITALSKQAGITKHKLLVNLITSAISALDIDGY